MCEVTGSIPVRSTLFMIFPSFKNELEYIEKGYIVVGCDEVGIGPLAGPVVAAACVLDYASIGKYRSKNKWYSRVRDSKTTTEAEREILLEKILEHTIAYGVGVVSQLEIDKINIHNASLLAMRRAVLKLEKKLKDKSGKIFVYVDGRYRIPEITH